MSFDVINLQDAALLIEVAETRSIRRVAERRNLAQPALSRRVRDLEAALGAPMFQRTRRGVELTVFGQSCVQHLVAWRAEGLRISRALSENLDRPPRLRLGTYDSVGIYYYPTLLQQVRATSLKCELELHLGRSREILQRLSNGELDLGLVFCGASRTVGLEIEPVAEDEYGFFESTQLRLSDDLHSIGDSTDDQGQTIRDVLHKIGLGQRRFVEAASFEVASALTVAGIGIGVLPTRVAAAWVKRKKLRPISMGGRWRFGRHHLSLVQAKTSPDRATKRLAQLIRSGFE